MENNNDLKILEEELYGINNAVNKAQDRLNIVNKTIELLENIDKLITETKTVSLESYDTQFNRITENIIKIKELAKQVDYPEITGFSKEELIPQGAISYNFNSINYNSLIMALPKSPPIAREELNHFIQELDAKHSNLMLQLTQLKSYHKKLDSIINKLSATALACYLCS